MVTLVPPEVEPLDGDTEVIIGVPGVTYVNVSEELEMLVPFAVVTKMSTLPTLAAGDVTTI